MVPRAYRAAIGSERACNSIVHMRTMQLPFATVSAVTLILDTIYGANMLPSAQGVKNVS